ncbi:uncharacterized protein PHACADRAFT_105903 [Phanerochaete carnosa HHB-10118-sp]|uniref:Uncharacterized protein n=1 Tax=Phanerochaete carnosa (strain HHB-10118-sp) TaxID=650164 RepID=K5UKQ2_PHACS|nr:uncharacterized protein PHACADRAFT_105903 [Phanerochaete carnosa HHB-10118-sp]EKM50226.1 hypothetical protein PHACADRAFT_105903 [Phanerochaete carnosa HHB-10118-sp]
MFFSQRLPSAPDEIYSSSLDTLHLGHALWYPEPHVTGEPHIGDVGFMREGAFVRLFNLDTSAPEKEVKFWPKRFENIESLPPDVLQIDSRSCPLVPDHYCSDGVERKEMHASVDVATSVGASATLSANYTCKAAQGAVLVLQSEAHTESLFENHLLHTYIARNYDKWYAYAKDDLGQAIQQESIIVIRGWVKTTSDWAAVAFRNTTTTTKFSLKGRVGNAVGAEMGGSRTSSVRGPRMQRQGKNYSAKASGLPVPEAKRNQCPFLKRYKLRRRPGFPWKVIASAGYHVLPDSGDARGTSGMEGVVAWDQDLDERGMYFFRMCCNAHKLIREQGEVLDPLDILLDYILENGYRVVDFASYLRQLQPPVRVDDTRKSLVSLWCCNI